MRRGLYKLVIVCDVEQQKKKRAVGKKGEEIEGNYTSKGDGEDESDGEQRSITRKKKKTRDREEENERKGGRHLV